jgi:hypothetical protein
MLLNQPIFLELVVAMLSFAAGTTIANLYYAHRAYQLRLSRFRARMAGWALSG